MAETSNHQKEQQQQQLECFIDESAREKYSIKDLGGLCALSTFLPKERYITPEYNSSDSKGYLNTAVNEIITNSRLIIAKLTGDYTKDKCTPLNSILFTADPLYSQYPLVDNLEGLDSCKKIFKQFRLASVDGDDEDSRDWSAGLLLDIPKDEFWSGLYPAPLDHKPTYKELALKNNFSRQFACHYPVEKNFAISAFDPKGLISDNDKNFSAKWDKEIEYVKRTIKSCLKYFDFMYAYTGEILMDGANLEEFYEAYGPIFEKLFNKKDFMAAYMGRLNSTKSKLLEEIEKSIEDKVPTIYAHNFTLEVVSLEGFFGEGKTKLMKDFGLQCYEPDMVYRAQLKDGSYVSANQSLIVAYAIFGKVVELLHNALEPTYMTAKWPSSKILVTDRFMWSHDFFNELASNKVDGIVSKRDETLWKLEAPPSTHTRIPVQAWMGLYRLHGFNIDHGLPFVINVHVYLKQDRSFLPWPIHERRTMETALYPSQSELQTYFDAWYKHLDKQCQASNGTNRTSPAHHAVLNYVQTRARLEPFLLGENKPLMTPNGAEIPILLDGGTSKDAKKDVKPKTTPAAQQSRYHPY